MKRYIIVSLLIIGLLAIGSKLIISGVSMAPVNNKYDIELQSMSDVENQLPFKVDIPDAVLNSDNLHYSIFMNKVLQINNTVFVLKASEYVADNVDVLGIYTESEHVEKFRVQNSDIVAFRYRTGNKDYQESTIINWNTKKVQYGLLIAYPISLDEALDIVGIDKNNLDNLSVSNNGLEYIESVDYKLNNGTKIKLPIFKSQYRIDEQFEFTFIAIGDTLVAAIMPINSNGFLDGQKIRNIDSHYCVKYRNDNPFEDGTTEYYDVDNLYKLLDNI